MKKSKLISLFIVTLMLFTLLTGCGTVTDENRDGLRIVATSFPAYDFARELAHDKAEIVMLLSPGEESHTFEPTPKDMMTLSSADLFIMGGGTSDEWAKELSKSAGLTKENVFYMMDCVNLENTNAEHHHESETVHDHSKFYEYDEHVWTSPLYAKEICKHLLERLIALDNKNASYYEEQYNRYEKELEKLNREFLDAVSNGAKKTLIFGDRFPFRYFADLYGLTYYSAFPGCAGETEPDAKTVRFLIDKIKAENIQLVLFTELSSQKIADAICEASGAKKALLHSCHNVTKDEFLRNETYLSLMRKNVSVIKEALS